MNNYYLGIDGGGTKTEAVITDQTGQIMGRGLAGGSNFHNTAKSDLIRNIQTAIDQAISDANLQNPVSFTAACLGISGLDSVNEIAYFQTVITPKISTTKLLVCNDGLVSFHSGTSEKTGITLIASTGASCFGILPDGQQLKAGDWGYLLGDQGSGFDIGQKIIQHSVKEFDGRCPRTQLVDKVLSHFQAENLAALSQIIYQPTPPIDQIAGVAMLISDPELISHPAIISITQHAVADLFESFITVAQKLNYQHDSHFPLIFTGKLFKAQSLITAPLTQKISSAFTSVEIIIPTKAPVMGAIQIALTL